jgi:hypothetical protein
MLERRKSEGYKIIPILLRECNFHHHDELQNIQFVKTYQNEYNITHPLSRDTLMPFDKLINHDDPFLYLQNLYFLKIAQAIDEAVGR